MPRRPWLTNSGKTKYEIEVTRERHTAEKLKKYSGELIFLSGCRRGFQADFVWMLKDSWCQGDKESRGNRCWGWKETSRALLYPHIPLLTVPHLLQNLRAENRWMRREFGKLRSGRERWAEKWGTGLWIQNHQICGYSWVACCCCLVTKSCLTLCDPMSCSMPGFPVLHSLLQFAQAHVHRIGDAIQPSHPLSSLLLLPSIFPASGSFPMSQLFTSGSKILEFQLQHQSFQCIFRTDFL